LETHVVTGSLKLRMATQVYLLRYRAIKIAVNMIAYGNQLVKILNFALIINKISDGI
jgi:hypothetical protein